MLFYRLSVTLRHDSDALLRQYYTTGDTGMPATHHHGDYRDNRRYADNTSIHIATLFIIIDTVCSAMSHMNKDTTECHGHVNITSLLNVTRRHIRHNIRWNGMVSCRGGNIIRATPRSARINHECR